MVSFLGPRSQKKTSLIPIFRLSRLLDYSKSTQFSIFVNTKTRCQKKARTQFLELRLEIDSAREKLAFSAQIQYGDEILKIVAVFFLTPHFGVDKN